jgi:hypothetical protein
MRCRWSRTRRSERGDRFISASPAAHAAVATIIVPRTTGSGLIQAAISCPDSPIKCERSRASSSPARERRSFHQRLKRRHRRVRWLCQHPRTPAIAAPRLASNRIALTPDDWPRVQPTPHVSQARGAPGTMRQAQDQGAGQDQSREVSDPIQHKRGIRRWEHFSDRQGLCAQCTVPFPRRRGC